MFVTAITWNVNNGRESISHLEDLINNQDDSELICISIQEYYKNLEINIQGYDVVFKQNVYGLWCCILKKNGVNNIEVEDFNKLCLGKGFLGNKGSISCYIKDLFVFISCHLSAGENNDLKREKEIDYILRRVKHDRIILSGDLNFRNFKINKNKPSPDNDQSVTIKEKYKLYENAVDFPPTYKYRKFTSTLDCKRAPSYCDRILIKERNKKIKLNSHVEKGSEIYDKDNMALLNYVSFQNITSSDHKPVKLSLSLNNHKSLVRIDKCLPSQCSCFVYDNLNFILLFFILVLLKIIF